VRLAVKRHAGTVQTIYTVSGPAIVQRGKDLTDVHVVIGTGARSRTAGSRGDPRDRARRRRGAVFAAAARAEAPARPGVHSLCLRPLGQVEPRQALALGLAHLTL
jgi:hypothetical protein